MAHGKVKIELMLELIILFALYLKGPEPGRPGEKSCL